MLDAQQWAEISTSPVAYVFAGVLGALWGSFANVCIYRMPPSDENPDGLSVVTPGSHCLDCGADVRWYDNVPLLSFLWLRGRCRDCGAEFSARYLLVEAATALLFLAAYHYIVALAYWGDAPGDQLIRFGVLAAFLWVLVVITFIDLDHQMILNKITYPAIPAFYGLGLLLPGSSWWRGLIGIAVGYGLIRLIADGYWLLTKREGMGYGDGKLLAIIGALFGWQAVFVSLFLGSMLGSIISIALLLIFRGAPESSASEASGEQGDADEGAGEAPELGLGRVAVPFGPFLALAAIIYAFSESTIRLQFTLPWQ